jgi:succinate dehydrogenase / fumarate reductase, iron-sulfur subunit
MMEVQIYRYQPEKAKKPYMQTFHVNPDKITGIMLLDALESIKTQDDTLGFRRSCGGGVCGSDGMNINGKNGLACQTTLDSLGDKVVIRPLPGMPVIRDLIVDLTRFYKQYESVKPYLKNRQDNPDKERLQSVEDRDKLDGHYECILCACCTTSCPSFWWNPDEFVGPAGLLWACRFILDSRDTEEAARLEDLEGLYRLYRCRGIMNCADVCPKGLNPSQAIHKIQSRMRQKATG